jgi:predicted PurR-regulated permease PerM
MNENIPTGVDRQPLSNFEIAAWVLSGAALFFILKLHLLPALFSGLLVYGLVHGIAPSLRITRLEGRRARLAAVALLAMSIAVLVAFMIWGIMVFLNRESGHIPALLKKMAEIIDDSREKFPPWLTAYLPENAESLKRGVVQWLREHPVEIQGAGKEAGRVAAHVLIGLVLGALISLREALPVHFYRPLALSITRQAFGLSRAFRSVVFAQVRISALNTLFAWAYLGLLLPLLGIHLPLVKTMVALTFITGLLPIVGNLISNTVIFIVSLSHSLSVATGSLIFLVVIHKAEYFLNARIIGGRIHASAWELLMAMLVMESAFGLSGLIAAPVYYAYIKNELAERGLV